jgi:predicted regulator of Ras-like GTPase activity (Roadblock/LC7/MglB family)
MAVPAAFSDLMEISSQIGAAVVLDAGETFASSLADEKRSEELAQAIRRLVDSAEKARGRITQIEVALPEGHVFVVRAGDRLIGAVTESDPPSGLVLYDLRTCLTGLAAERAGKSDAAE